MYVIKIIVIFSFDTVIWTRAEQFPVRQRGFRFTSSPVDLLK